MTSAPPQAARLDLIEPNSANHKGDLVTNGAVESASGEYEFLRDYLYLDVDKVKSIAGQFDFGTLDEVRETTVKKRKGAVGWDKVLSVGGEKSHESYVQRSMLDSLFPELESELEDGWLVDISREFAKGGEYLDEIKSLRPEGSLFRLTAPGLMFNPEFFQQSMVQFSSLLGGVEMLTAVMSADQEGAGIKKGAPPKSRRSNSEAYRNIPESPVAEDFVETFTKVDESSPEYFKSIMRMVRGFSSDGTTLFLESDDGDNAITLSARFQQNRRYFDADPILLASQYGLSRQTWTIVGTIGHYTRPLTEVQLLSALESARGTLGADGTFRRRYLIRMMSNVMHQFGASGVSDIPQHPGISAIPIAVYRTFTRA